MALRLGPAVRRLFGRHEHGVAEAYRRMFVDLDELIERTAPDVQPRNILEVGCGEGAVTSRLAAAFPAANILASDVSPRVGRLFRGDGSRVSFVSRPVEQVAAEQAGHFDLVFVVDVVHHLPVDTRQSFLRAARETMAPGGVLVLKDWARSTHPIHAMAWVSDRLLTGDTVHFCDARELRELTASVFGQDAIRKSLTISPWSNNVVFVIGSG